MQELVLVFWTYYAQGITWIGSFSGSLVSDSVSFLAYEKKLVLLALFLSYAFLDGW